MAGIDVAAVPLFERLIDGERWTPREAKPLRTLDRVGLRRSVANEVERLLNTRCSLTVDQACAVSPRDRTVLDYGIPDFTILNPLASEDAIRLTNSIRNSLIAFEPRLLEPRVYVMGLDSRQRSVVIALVGRLRLGTQIEPFSFAISVEQANQAPVGESNAA